MAKKAAKAKQEETIAPQREARPSERDTLQMLIRARVPIISVRAWDTADVMKWVKQLAQDTNKYVIVWSATRGIEIVNTVIDADGNEWVYDTDDKDVFIRRSDDKTGANRRKVGSLADWGLPPKMQSKVPPAALRAALDFSVPASVQLPGASGKPINRAIFVLFRYGTYLGNPEIQQLVEDAHLSLREQPKTVLMLAPDTDVPPTLGKLIKSFDWPYPSYAELSDLVLAYQASVNERAKAKGEPMIELTDIDLDLLTKGLQGMTMREADSAMKELVVARGTIDATMPTLTQLRKHKQEVIKAQGGVLEYVAVDANSTQIGGVDLLKKYIEESSIAFDPGAAKFAGGVDIGSRGVLLGGPPGTGKSLASKSIANELGLPLVRLDMGAIFGPLLGSSEATLRNALATVEAVAPCVFWMDEVEKGFNSNGGDLDGGASARVLATLLTWFQERAKQADVFVVATCNWIENVDPALQQRFTERFFIDLPGPMARREIMMIKFAERGRDNPQAIGLDIDALADASQWFSPREIEASIDEAMRRAYLRVKLAGSGDVTTEDVLGVFTETVPLAHQRRAEVARMRAWGETARSSSSEPFDGVDNVKEYAKSGDARNRFNVNRFQFDDQE